MHGANELVFGTGILKVIRVPDQFGVDPDLP